MYAIEIHVKGGSVVFWKKEGLPLQVVPGTAGTIAVYQLDPESRQTVLPHFGRYTKLPVLTRAERDQYMRAHWPGHYEAEQMARDESLATSGL